VLSVRRAVLLLFALFASGCDTSIHERIGPDAAYSTACMEAGQHDDLVWIVKNVFEPSCSFNSCHNTNGRAERLDLTSAYAYASLVGKPSLESPGWTRVVAGDPNHSYLLVKMGEQHGPLGDAGTTMPPRNALICAPKREAVARWISHGATEIPLDAGIADARVLDGEAHD
jgi:hypothetical protein